MHTGLEPPGHSRRGGGRGGFGGGMHELSRLFPQWLQGRAELLPSPSLCGGALDRSGRHPCRERRRLGRWWTVFNDPKLNELITCAYRQNLTLKEAVSESFRRGRISALPWERYSRNNKTLWRLSSLGVAAGNSNSPVFGSRYSDRWDFGFSLGWESISGAGSAGRSPRPTTS